MTFALILHGRVVARGTWSTIVEAGSERGVIRVDTLGHDTAEPVHVPRLTDRAARIEVRRERNL